MIYVELQNKSNLKSPAGQVPEPAIKNKLIFNCKVSNTLYDLSLQKLFSYFKTKVSAILSYGAVAG